MSDPLTPERPLDAVTVAMPLRTPAYWRNQLAGLAAGTAEWRAAQRNLMASLAATSDGERDSAADSHRDERGEDVQKTCRRMESMWRHVAAHRLARRRASHPIGWNPHERPGCFEFPQTGLT